jgi:hypothetical protein
LIPLGQLTARLQPQPPPGQLHRGRSHPAVAPRR